MFELPKPLARRAMRECDEMMRSEHARGIFDDGDPNHPKHNSGINYTTGQPARIFGYETKKFMKRQYRGPV